MIITKRVTKLKEREEIYRERYKIFVERDKDAPAELYTDGILKDDCDDNALHIACYESEDNSLLGFLTVVLKENAMATLPIEEQHGISVEVNTAEIMRLIIFDKLNMKNKGHVLGSLLAEVEKVVAEFNLIKLYLVTTVKAQKIYQRIGFKQIGPYKLYKGISNECPMALDIKNVTKKFFKGVSYER